MSSSVQFGGLVSGLNTQSIVDALMGVEKQPLTRLQAKEADLTAQKAAYGQFGASVDKVVASIKAFTTSSAGASRMASSADTSVLTASASPNAAVAQYQISVDRLASASRATSMSSLGGAVTGAVDTTKTLTADSLATPITAGHMTTTIDGAAIQVTVGDPASTTLDTLIGSIASAVQMQLQTTDATATVSASVVGGQLQLIVSGAGAPHSISFGDVADTSNAASALGLASQGVVGASNPTITGTAYLDPTLSSLNLPGSITAGQISAVVDGVIVHYTVGDPKTTTLDRLMKGFGDAIQTQLRAAGGDPTAAVAVSVSGNRLQLAITGLAAHSISFGAASDSSNALGMLGIANQSATNTLNPTITGATNLGVVRTMSALDSAGLSGLASTKVGVLTINGVAINYDSTGESLTTIITRINNSAAGVVVSLDRTNDKLVMTRRDTGALAIDIQDTVGTLGAALKLAPGTTNAQVVGQTAQVTVDGRTVTSTGNTVTNAIDGVTLNLQSQSDLGDTTTLNVGVDQSAVAGAMNNFIQTFNALGDTLDKLTSSTPGQAGGTAGSAGPLSSDPTALTLFLGLRDLLMQAVDTTNLNSLGSLGVNTGAVGSAVGSTTRLQLDSNKLTAALNSDPTKVAQLLDGASGPLKAVLDRLMTFENPDDSTVNTYVRSHSAGLDTEISSLHGQESDMQARIDAYQAAIEAKYAALESTLALLQSQSSQVSAQITSMNNSTNG